MKLLGIIRIVLRAKIFHETPSLFVQTQHGRSLFATENELSRVCTCTTSVYTYKRARVPVGRRSNENPENAAQLVPRSVTKLLTWLDFRANEPESSSYAGEFRWLGPVAHVENTFVRWGNTGWGGAPSIDRETNRPRRRRGILE